MVRYDRTLRNSNFNLMQPLHENEPLSSITQKEVYIAICVRYVRMRMRGCSITFARGDAGEGKRMSYCKESKDGTMCVMWCIRKQ